MIDRAHFDVSKSGTTAISLLFLEKTVYTANTGDSRAVIGMKKRNKWENFDLSRDHKPDSPKERQRIA